MTRLTLATAALLLVAVTPGAAQQTPAIRGTSIEDSPAHRAILDTCDKYRQALLRRDADTVLRVVSPRYRDDGGTPDPADDVDRAELERTLSALLAGIESVTYEARYLSLRRRGDSAAVEVEYTGSFRIGGRELSRRDRHVIELEHAGGRWLITSGL